MNLAAVVDFIANNRATSAYVMPAVGHVGKANPVFKAQGGERDRLALVVSGLGLQDGAYSVVGCFVRDLVQRKGGVGFRIGIDQAFPDQAIDIAKLDESNPQAVAAWESAHSDYDDSNDNIKGELADKLSAVPDYSGTPQLQFHAKFVRWSELVNGQQTPRGVILIAPDRRLYALGFPNHEDDAMDWNRFANCPDDALEQLPSIVGRSTFVSVPETIKGESWEDAPLRALHKFGADYYNETGRTMFP